MRMELGSSSLRHLALLIHYYYYYYYKALSSFTVQGIRLLISGMFHGDVRRHSSAAAASFGEVNDIGLNLLSHGVFNMPR